MMRLFINAGRGGGERNKGQSVLWLNDWLREEIPAIRNRLLTL
jgi:hypothetical protein